MQHLKPARSSGRFLLLLLPLLLAAAIAAAPITAQTRNFIWKASGTQGTVYLVGSVHMLSKDYYPLSPALDTAFAGV